MLQHAYVYGFKTVVLAISDTQSEIIRSVIIDFTEELQNHFDAVLKDMKDFSLDWIYDCLEKIENGTIPIPPKISSIASTVKILMEIRHYRALSTSFHPYQFYQNHFHHSIDYFLPFTHFGTQ